MVLGCTIAYVAPITAQEGVSLTDAIDAAIASHPSVVQAESTLYSATLSLRLAEINHRSVTLTLHATPALGKVSLTPWDGGSFSDVANTFDADGSATISAAVALPWGMSISGSYTANIDLDDIGTGSNEELFTDSQSISISQDLLHPGPLAPTAIALDTRRNDHRLALLRLKRTQNDTTRQVISTFLDIVDRTKALSVLTERLNFAEHDLANIQTRFNQQAESELALLNARINLIQRHNAISDAQFTLDLDTKEFFAELGLQERPLVTPTVQLDALRQSARSVIERSITGTVINTTLSVIEAEIALAAAEKQSKFAVLGSLPNLSLSLDYTKGEGTPRLGNLSLSLTGSYDLFDDGRQTTLIKQAEEQVVSARRSLATARNTTRSYIERARHDLQRAINIEFLSTLQMRRARLQSEEATRQHAAGLISGTELSDADLKLLEEKDTADAAAFILKNAYLALALQMNIDIHDALSKISG